MSPLYAGIGGVVRELTEMDAGVNGVVKPMTEMWAGVGGVNRQIFSAGGSMELVSVTFEWNIPFIGEQGIKVYYVGDNWELKSQLTPRSNGESITIQVVKNSIIVLNSIRGNFNTISSSGVTSLDNGISWFISGDCTISQE